MTLPGAVAFVLEPPLFLLADRHPRRRFVVAGLLLMATGCAAMALAGGLGLLAVGTSLFWLGSGLAVSLGQATLVDLHPDAPERVLARWALAGEVGDLLAPLGLVLAAALGAGWRGALVGVAVAALVGAGVLVRYRFPPGAAPASEAEPGAEPGAEPVRGSLRLALGRRELLLWLGAATLAELLDEVVVVFATARLTTSGLSTAEVGGILATGVVGAIVGAAATERLLRRVSSLALLVGASALCVVAYGAWLVVDSAIPSALLLAVVSASAAPMYPLTIARAYAALPGRSGAVNAVAHLFTPLMLGAVWGLGVLADRYGAGVALAALMAQPVGIGVLAAATRRAERRRV